MRQRVSDPHGLHTTALAFRLERHAIATKSAGIYPKTAAKNPNAR